jgi:phosphoenolpyruvate synthase/pyruvate phosphate dikinase
MSTAITTTKGMSEDLQSPSTTATRYQDLKKRKEALEKKLNEKYEQLHQLCQKVRRLFRDEQLRNCPGCSITTDFVCFYF